MTEIDNKLVSYIKLVDKIEKQATPFFESRVQELNAAIKKYEAGTQSNNVEQELRANVVALKALETQTQKIHRGKTTHGFQFARYDGALKGTEVGMTLFYTDLVAKLWTLNYADSTPIQQIYDFLPVTQAATKISSIYKNELSKNLGSRLWFDPQEKGYQKLNNNGSETLLFAPTAAKVNAKSNDPLNPQQGEKIATPRIQAFLSWWDRHYDEISKYEPQYQKLNQVMKWSLAIAWLERPNEKDPLEFLSSVKVNQSNWFPTWAKSHKQQLKFQYWSEGSSCQPAKSNNPEPVCFYPKGYQGHATESMPVLASKEFEMFGESGNYIDRKSVV